MAKTAIRPLYDRVVVRRCDSDEETVGGIIIPDTAKEKPQQGIIVAIGNGKPLDSGDHRALAVEKGQRILFGKYAGTEVKIDGEDLIIMREDDILAIIA